MNTVLHENYENFMCGHKLSPYTVTIFYVKIVKQKKIQLASLVQTPKIQRIVHCVYDIYNYVIDDIGNQAR